MQGTSNTTAPVLSLVRADWESAHLAWWRTALLFAVLTLACLLLGQVDARLLNGVSVWDKPFKFSLSFIVYFLTLVSVAPLMPAQYFQKYRGRLLTWLPIICALGEIAYIGFQASLGEASHFNYSSAFHIAMYSAMGVGAVILVGVCAWMGISLLIHRGWSDPLIVAIAVGLILTFVLGGGFGGYLSSQQGHWVNAPATDADGVWLFHWTRQGGDLRVAHFFGMHAMQIIPLLTLPFCTRGETPVAAYAALVSVSIGLSAVVLLTFYQAINGIPFIG